MRFAALFVVTILLTACSTPGGDSKRTHADVIPPRGSGNVASFSGRHIYVGGAKDIFLSQSPEVDVFDVGTGDKLAAVPLSPTAYYPSSMVLSADQSKLYIAMEPDYPSCSTTGKVNVLQVLDTATNRIVQGSAPPVSLLDIKLVENDSRIVGIGWYSAGFGAFVFDAKTLALLKTIPLTFENIIVGYPERFAVTNDGKYAFMGDNGRKRAIRVNLGTGEITGFSAPDPLFYLHSAAVDSTDTKIYAPSLSNTIYVFDVNTLTPLKQINLSGGIVFIDESQDRSTLVANTGISTSIISMDSDSVVRAFSAATVHGWLYNRVNPDGSLGLFYQERSTAFNTVTIFELATGALIGAYSLPSDDFVSSTMAQ